MAWATLLDMGYHTIKTALQRVDDMTPEERDKASVSRMLQEWNDSEAKQLAKAPRVLRPTHFENEQAFFEDGSRLFQGLTHYDKGNDTLYDASPYPSEQPPGLCANHSRRK